MKVYQYATNSRIVGKTDPQKLSYAGAWEPTKGTLSDLAQHIGKGHPWMPAVLDGNRKRWQSNANYAEILSLDIDAGMTIVESLEHEQIRSWCGLGIESSSSTPELNKFRLVFPLAEPLKNNKEIRLCNTYLQHLVGTADKACKDASRFYFGGLGRVPFLLNDRACLPLDFLQRAKDWQSENDRIRAEEQRAKALERIAKRERIVAGGGEAIDLESLIRQANDRLAEDAFLPYLDCQNQRGNDRKYRVQPAFRNGSGSFSAFVSQSADGTWLYVDPSGGHPAVDGFRFFCWQKRGGQGFKPSGAEFWELLREYAGLAGLELPEFKRKNPLRWLSRLLGKQKPKGFLPATPSAPQIYDLEYAKGDRLKVWEGITAKYILDRSGTGYGKGHDAGLIQKRFTFVTGEHRNPTTPTLAELHDLESRHAGLVEEITQDGGKRLRRAKAGQVPNTPANCSRSEELNKLRSLVGSDADQATTICKSCKLYEVCNNMEGKGFGYLRQRRTALGRDRFRAHPASLPSPKAMNADGLPYFDYSDRLMVWDEASVNFETHETIEFSEADIEKTVMALLQSQALSPDIQAVLAALLAILNDRKGLGRHGLNHAEVLDKLHQGGMTAVIDGLMAMLNGPQRYVGELLAYIETCINLLNSGEWELEEIEFQWDLDPIEVALDPHKFIEQALNPTAAYGINIQDLPASQRKFYATKSGDLQGIPKTWLVPLLKVLNGEYPGATITANHGGFTITLPNDRYREIAKAAKQNIFTDATLTREDLAVQLGVDPSEIFVIREKPIATPNLKIYQVADMGKLTRDRGKDQKKRVTAFLDTLGCPAIDWKSEKREGAHFVDSRGVNHFQSVTRLAIVGTPCPNIGAMVCEFSAMAGRVVTIDDPDFKSWLHRRIESELLQAIGRVRANRRLEESIEVYLLTDHQFETISPIQKTSAEICPDAAPKGDRTRNAMIKAAKAIIMAGDKLTQEGLAAVLEKSRGGILRGLTSLEMGWDDFKKMILLLINTPIAEGSEKSSVVVKLIETIAPYLEFRHTEEIFSFALGLPDPDLDLLEFLGGLLDSPPPPEPA